MRRRGHYCWSCDCVLANEKFSGRGHARHLCKACAKLGTEELAYRQAMRDLERLATREGFIPRRRRRQFAAFLEHEDSRIRTLALEMQQVDAEARALERLLREEDEASWETEEDVVLASERFDDPMSIEWENVEPSAQEVRDYLASELREDE